MDMNIFRRVLPVICRAGSPFFLRSLRYKNYTVFVTKYHFGSGSSLLPKWYSGLSQKIKGRSPANKSQ